MSDLSKRIVENRVVILVRVTMMLVALGISVLVSSASERAGVTLASVLEYIYGNSLTIGLASLILVPVLLGVMDRLSNKRPFLHVPFDAAWWECIVFGISGTVFGLFSVAILAGAFFVLPIVVPIRLLFVYTFGSDATPATAIASFVAIGGCSALLFTFGYLLAMQHRWGTLTAISSQKDLTGSILETFYFSMGTLLSSSPGDISPTGACRWLALLQLLVGKLLEIIVIGAGLSILLQGNS